MASKVSGYIGKINPNNGTTQYSLGSTAYGYCETAAATAAKTVDMTGFTLIEGATIFIKFKYNNTATDDPTLNVQGTGAKPLIPKTWQSGAILSLTFDGTSWVEATTYSLNAAVNAGTASQIAYYSTNNTISGVGDTASPIYGLRYYHTNSSAHTPAALSRLHVYGVTYGNTADNMISNTAGLFSYGDGGPQITFSYSADGGQAGALIYTDNDAAGAGASWNFVTTESDWNVTSKRFHARTGISVGTNLPPRTTTPYPTDDYNLYVNGTSRFALGTSDNTSNKKFIIGSSGERYLSFGGAGVQAYNASDAISTLHLNYSGGPVYIGNGVSASSTSSELRIKGRVVVDPYYHSTNSFSEFRVNRASNGWSGITLGGAKDSLSTTGLGIWLVGTKATPGDATTEPANITDSQFYISYNGSNSAACRIQGHNATGFSIRPRLAVNANVNTDYNFYVNGSSFFYGQAIGNAASKEAFLVQHGTASKEAGFRAKRTDNTGDVWMGVGSGGVNHGLFSQTLNKWMIVADASSVTVNGNAENVTGTVAIANGGTGATTRLAAARNLTSENVTSPDYVVSLTQSWANFGYTSIANLKTKLGLGANTTAASSATKQWIAHYTNATTIGPTSTFYFTSTPSLVADREGSGQGFTVATAGTQIGRFYSGTRGTTSTNGITYLIVGNNLANGTAENAEGVIQLHGSNTGRHRIQAAPNANTSNYYHYLPHKTGWIASGGTATAGSEAGVGSASQPVYLSSAGVLTACNAMPQMQIVARTGTGTNSWSVSFDFAPDFISVLGYRGLDDGSSYVESCECIMANITTSWTYVRAFTKGYVANGLVLDDLPGSLSPIQSKKSSDGKTYYTQINSTAVSNLPSELQPRYGTGLMGGPYRIFNESDTTYYLLAIKAT